jgi:hypothetical protein
MTPSAKQFIKPMTMASAMAIAKLKLMRLGIRLPFLLATDTKWGAGKMKTITMADCRELYHRFTKYTETAEQHEFAKLAMINMMLDTTMARWSDPIDQKEARVMFRVVLGAIGEDITPYKEEN